MARMTEFLELICSESEKHCDLDTGISLKELPKEGGLYAELGEGFTDALYFDKKTEKTIPVLFLCRCKKQSQGFEHLEQICDYWQRMKSYPQGKSFSLLDVTIAKEPNKIGRDEDGVYHFSCILNCKIYY